METLMLGASDVDKCAEMPDIIQAVEEAFEAYARGSTQMPAKSYIDLPQFNGDFRSMPAYMETDNWAAAGIKWVNVHPDNPAEFDVPTVMGTMIYSDPENGFPLAVLDGTTLTMLRTGAAAAVATKYLARTDATSLGIVGAGVQSYTQLEAIAAVRDIERVVISDKDESAIQDFIDIYGSDYDIHGGSVSEATECDILSTITPVRDPIVSSVSPGTHINAMGADAEGKHEIADEVLKVAKVFIDDFDQCTHSGEINIPWSTGELDKEDIAGEICDILTGQEEGRTSSDEVTLFDSTGLAIQDVAAARVIYNEATETGSGTSFELVG